MFNTGLEYRQNVNLYEKLYVNEHCDYRMAFPWVECINTSLHKICIMFVPN